MYAPYLKIQNRVGSSWLIDFLLYKTTPRAILWHLGNPNRLEQSCEPSSEFRSDFEGEEKIGRRTRNQHPRSKREIKGLLVYPFSLPLMHLLLLFFHEILLLLFYHVWLNTHSRGDGL
jgi:hypothetical protein